MAHGRSWLVALLIPLVTSVPDAQTPPSQATFPAPQREPPGPELLVRGRALYDNGGRGGHGVDLRGRALGGPNLLRSQLVLSDRDGENIWPVLRDDRMDHGAPAETSR